MTRRNIVQIVTLFLGGWLLIAAHGVLDNPDSSGLFRTLWNGYEQTFLVCSFVGYFLVFIYILERRDKRLVKGVTLIFYGLIFSTQYPDLVMLDIPEAIKTDNIKYNLELLVQVSIFASAGAGGSLIATHADDFSEDNQVRQNREIVLDKTKSISELETAVDDLKWGVFGLKVVILILSIIVVFK